MAARLSDIGALLRPGLMKLMDADPNEPIPHRPHWSEVWYDEMRAKGWKYAIRPHRPGYFSGDDEEFFAERATGFNEPNDWLKLAWVKSWEEDGGKFRRAKEEYGERLISHKGDDGKSWVIGYWKDLTKPKYIEPMPHGPWLPNDHPLRWENYLRKR